MLCVGPPQMVSASKAFTPPLLCVFSCSAGFLVSNAGLIKVAVNRGIPPVPMESEAVTPDLDTTILRPWWCRTHPAPILPAA